MHRSPMRRMTASAALLVAGMVAAAPAGAQTINETQPGGVENRPSLDGMRAVAPPPAAGARSFSAPKPQAPIGTLAPSSARKAADMKSEAGKPDAAKGGADAAKGGAKADDKTDAGGAKKSKKRSAGPKAAAPAAEMERSPAAPGSSMPQPRGPNETIPGGVERAPGNAQ